MPSTPITIAQIPDHSPVNPLLDLYRRTLTAKGVIVHRHTMYPRANAAEPRLSARWLWKHRHTVQVLHFHWYQRLYQSDDSWFKTLRKFLGFIARVLLARKLGYHIVWTAHNLFPHEQQYPLLDIWARWLITYLAEAVFVESTTAKNAVQQVFPWIQTFVEAPQGHFVGVYPPGKSMAEARAELDIPSDAFVFLAFGLIRPYKGLETLIRIFLTSFASPRCFLVIAGNPCSAEARTTIERLTASSPYVRLKLGLVPNDQIETLFNACNVAVFPFYCTFTSSSIILACSLGRPVVIPLIGALPRVEKSGFFTYDPSDPHGLPQAMQESMSADWYEQGKQAKRLIVQRDWCEIGDRMVKTYTTIVGGHQT